MSDLTPREQETFEVLRHIIETRTEHRGTVGPDSDLVRDLELDSVSRTGVLVALEDHYKITLEGDVILETRTVRQLIALVHELVDKR